MRTPLRVSIAVLLTAFALGFVWPSASLRLKAAGGQAPPAARPAAPGHRAALDRFCVTCHNARLRTAGLLLDQADVDHPEADAATWEKVLHKLRAREMPPAGVPHHDDATYSWLAAYLETALDAAAAAHPNP
ncbi:MAG TPA: c-type cytochrome domain-containing protein, partial [Vicinamibacterales bacterium]|nr:c-type cytochrome domain-containing protein [Vicinamibacterales bacterium]